jgi:predicted DNA-binding protein with PD1-like motif
MSRLALALAFVGFIGTAGAQETRTTLTRTSTAADSLPNDRTVPDVQTIPASLQRVMVVRLKYDTDVLKGLESAVGKSGIRNAVILAGIGSVRNYRFHVVGNRTLPTANTFVVNPTGPADIAGMNGYVIGGRIHAHMTLASADRAFGGHLEPGTTVYTFAIITLGILGDDIDLSRVDDTTYR